MIALMARAILVAALLALAALAVEGALPARRRSRWIWAGAILAAATLPWLGGLVPTGPDLVPWGRLLGSGAADVAAVPSPVSAVPAAGSPGRGVDAYLLGGWIVATVTLLAVLAIAAVRLRRLIRTSAPARLAGVPVRLTPHLGPAVVGVVRPRIAVPRWLLALSPPEIRLALDHEREHLRAGDTRLLAFAALTCAAMPWSLPLWWMTRRLARAVEADCDARVLARHDAADYGRLLLRVASFGGASRPPVLALVGAQGNLERRIMAMSSTPKRFRVLVGLPLLAAGLGALLAACDAADGPTELDASPVAAVQGTFTVAEVPSAKEVGERMQPRLQLQPPLGLDVDSHRLLRRLRSATSDLESAILRAHGHGDAEGESAVETLSPIEGRFREEAVSRYELRAVEGTRAVGVLRAVGVRRAEAARLDGTPSQSGTFKMKEIAPRQR